MIHEYIFACPRPGLSAAAFTSYWINFHARDYAAKIPQIRKYLVARRLRQTHGPEVPDFEGVAEIWMNADEQIAALQSPEFLDGARRDEPRWAAFWQTFVHDGEVSAIAGRDDADDADYVKLYLFLKRRPGLDLAPFRTALRRRAEGLSAALRPCHHILAFARDGAYGLGEPRMDALEVLSFRDAAAIERLLADASFSDAMAAGWSLCDPKQLFSFVGQETWIIRPGER